MPATFTRYRLVLLILCPLMAAVTGCAATGEPFKCGEPVSDNASLYIYYSHGPFSSSLGWPVFLDHVKLTELGRGGYFYSTLSTGMHTISTKRDSIERSLNISSEADGISCVRLR